MTFRSEEQRDRPPIAAHLSLNQLVRDKPVHKADHPRVRKTEYAAKLIVGRPQPIADDDQGGRRLTRTVQNLKSDLSYTVCDSQSQCTQQICRPVLHSPHLRAPRIFYN
jgi:hypothetical protein